MKYHSEFEIFLSFLTHCSFIMGNGKLSSVPLQNGITLDIKPGETLEQNQAWKNHKDSFLKALSEAGDRAIVSAGGNHIFVFYRGNDNCYHAIGSLGKKTYGSIEDAVRAWATSTGTIMITTQKPQKELYESHVNGQLNAHLAVQDITGTLAYLRKKPYYDDNNIPYTYINYGDKIGDYVGEYTLKNWGLQAYNLDCTEHLQQIRSLVFENIDKIANGIPMNNQELMNNQNANNIAMNQMMNNNQLINNMGMNNMGNNNMNNPMVMNPPQFMPPNNMNNPMMNNMGNNNMNNPMGMNNQMGMNMGNNVPNQMMNNNMPPNNMNNQMMNNIGNNNMNNQMGMNNGHFIQQSIQNNPLMIQKINDILNLVDQKNNVGKLNSDHHSVKNHPYTSNQDGVDCGPQPVTSNMNNNPEYLFGLKCLGKKPQEISECCAKLYWPSCC